MTTAVFSLFYGVLLKPLPYPNPDALVMVYDTQPSCSTCPASFPKYIDWRTRNTVFSAIGGSTTGIQVITGVGEPELRRPTRPSSPGPELLIGVALLAVAVPAFQASRTDPMVVLRNDRGRGRFAALPSVCVDFGVCLGRE